jgi:hypothetical protein
VGTVSGRDENFPSLFHSVQTGLTHHPIDWVPEVKLTERQGDYSPHLALTLETSGSYTSAIYLFRCIHLGDSVRSRVYHNVTSFCHANRILKWWFMSAWLSYIMACWPRTRDLLHNGGMPFRASMPTGLKMLLVKYHSYFIIFIISRTVRCNTCKLETLLM